MPAVNNVLGRRRRPRRRRRPPSTSPRPASRSTWSRSSPTSPPSAPASRCRATRCACCDALGVWDAGAGGRLRLRRHRPPRARPGRHRRRRDPRRQDRRPGPARRHGHAPPRAGPDPARPGHRGRRQGPLRHDVHRARPRTTTASTSPSPTARPAATTSSSAPTASAPGPAARSASTSRPKSTGMGIWRAFGPRPGERRPAPTCLRRPVLHRRLLPHRRGLALRLPRRGRPGPLRRSRPRSSWPTMRELSQAYHGPWDEIRETLDRPVAGQLHLVRDARARRPRGTAAGSCSSATPRTPARPPSPRAPRRPSRTPSSSPSC